MAVTCTTSNLSELAACFSCLSPQELQAIQTYLLCQLANNGGGGGGSGTAYQTGNGSPVGVKTPTFIGEIYTRNDVVEVWKSTGLTNSNWTQVV